MKINSKDFRVKPNDNIKFNRCCTLVKPFYKTKEDYEQLLEKDVATVSDYQELFLASDRYALVLIFQGMDSAGKDGAIKHVMSGINPEGCDVFNFKQPSAEELQHDFLWRATQHLPPRGKISIFNRSYYEDVIVVRVHPKLLRAAGVRKGEEKGIWKGRFRSINDYEAHLYRNNTRVVKFFLHLSKAEQRRRFLARIDTPEKNWKFSDADIKERNYWEQYQMAYQACLNATSTKIAPWYIVPADDKLNARLIVSHIIIQTLKELKMKYPKVSGQRKDEFEKMRKELTK